MLQNLLEDPAHTFSYVEQAFFQRWAESASAQQLADMERMVSTGQLTFINGAWAMHDEASPSYIDMIVRRPRRARPAPASRPHPPPQLAHTYCRTTLRWGTA